MIRVLLVHDTELMRSALTALLDREEDIEVVAESWESAPDRARAQRPHVCVVDVDCPGASRLPSRPVDRDCALLVLATTARPGSLRRAAEAKALGFVDKDAQPLQLPRAIRLMATGRRYVDGTLALDLLRAATAPLTPRELGVLSLAAKGASAQEIARSLRLSIGTVRNYMCAITRKTGARNRIDAIRISRDAGWV
ncbi:LuxR C-terminal-related transcriptional regulator [Embleya sp. NPDC056575]|uniref:response regulator transcription factor n=1 Tax=unclassified Embleya TaxID=2699296 RepID=UPI0036A3BF89